MVSVTDLLTERERGRLFDRPFGLAVQHYLSWLGTWMSVIVPAYAFIELVM